MERLKTIDYVSGLTHKDVREAINANSEVANANFDELTEAANTAKQTAETAQQAANTAKQTAEAAQTAAGEAQTAAGEAKSTAEAAQTAAGEAKSTAETAQTAAGEAKSTAGAAQAAAGEAKSTAEAAREAATGAQGTAEAATRDAAQAKSDAAQAKSDAAQAKSDAAQAKSTAEGALSAAGTAGENAQTAMGSANAAVETAEAAQAAASAAQTAAEGAQRTAETANSTAGAAKTAADGAVKDAASAKSTAEAAQAAASTASQTASTAKSTADTAKQTADTAKQTAETAKQTADTAKSTADTAKQTAEGAKASAEGLTGDVTAMGLSQSFLADYAGTGEPVAAGAAAVSVMTSTLKKDELVPWHGWFTLVACYTTEDANAQIGAVGKHGESSEQVIVPLTKVSAGERVVAKLTADPGTRTVTLEGGDTVEVRKLTTTGALTLHWAVLYESDPYGNPRRRGGREREMIEGMLNSYVNSGIHTGSISKARYNERTGWFEVNGLTDMTFDDCLAVLGDFAPKVSTGALNNDFTSSARTNNALQGIYDSRINFNFANGCGEVICLGPQLRSNLSGFLYDGNANNGVIAILSYIRFQSNFTQGSSEIKAVNLETVDFRDLHTNLSLKNLASLSYETFRFMIEFATNSAAITVTVHADVYAKLTGGTVDDWGSLGTLADGKGVKLVSYGEDGYPFLTRVLWHGYKRLENKINAAKSGDVIYIHPDDRRKITEAQRDDWAALVTAGAEKQISFALPAES